MKLLLLHFPLLFSAVCALDKTPIEKLMEMNPPVLTIIPLSKQLDDFNEIRQDLAKAVRNFYNEVKTLPSGKDVISQKLHRFSLSYEQLFTKNTQLLTEKDVKEQVEKLYTLFLSDMSMFFSDEDLDNTARNHPEAKDPITELKKQLGSLRARITPFIKSYTPLMDENPFKLTVGF